jgi:hypothetical protein
MPRPCTTLGLWLLLASGCCGVLGAQVAMAAPKKVYTGLSTPVPTPAPAPLWQVPQAVVTPATSFVKPPMPFAQPLTPATEELPVQFLSVAAPSAQTVASHTTNNPVTMAASQAADSQSPQQTGIVIFAQPLHYREQPFNDVNVQVSADLSSLLNHQQQQAINANTMPLTQQVMLKTWVQNWQQQAPNEAPTDTNTTSTLASILPNHAYLLVIDSQVNTQQSQGPKTLWGQLHFLANDTLPITPTFTLSLSCKLVDTTTGQIRWQGTEQTLLPANQLTSLSQSIYKVDSNQAIIKQASQRVASKMSGKIATTLQNRHNPATAFWQKALPTSLVPALLKPIK